MKKVLIYMSIGFLGTCFSFKAATTPLNATNILQTHVDATGRPLIKTQYSKFDIPQGAMLTGKSMQFSLTRILDTLYHPTGGELFSDSGIAGALDSFLFSINKKNLPSIEERFSKGVDNYFIVYFARLQITIIQCIYQHLLSVYSNFLLTPLTQFEIYNQYQRRYAFNTKMLIVQYLLNIIEEHACQAVRYRFPAIPDFVASRLGPMILRNDYAADLYALLERNYAQGLTFVGDVATFDARRDLYLTIFGKYLYFFNQYGALIENKDKEFGTTLVQVGYGVNDVIDKNYPSLKLAQNDTPDTIMKKMRSHRQINPPLILHRNESLRSISVIVSLAEELTKSLNMIDWPALVVKDARQGTPIKDAFGNVMSNAPRAYFAQDDLGKQRLFVNIPRLDGIYAQEVKKQPLWLNSKEGVFSMVRACLGDYSMLFAVALEKEEILDPCTASIVIMAGITGGTISGGLASKARTYGALLTQKKKKEEMQLEKLPLPDATSFQPPVILS